MTVFCHFLENASLVLAIFAYFNRLEHPLQFLLQHHVRKKIRSPLFRPFCVQIRCFWHFFCHFLEIASFVLANIPYLYELDHSLHFLLEHHAPPKNPVTLFLAILCPNYAFFVLFSNRVNLGRADLYGSIYMLK